ncbi:MAG TPA: tetratricopeptide repeat protein [Bryobacteraceae bacterium]
MTALLIGVPLALLVLRPLVLPRVMPYFRASRAVFHFKDGAWTPTPQVPGGAWGLEVSSRGAVWTISIKGGLCRLDGDHWTHYGKNQFGSHADRLHSGLALRDEEVWGAIGEGAIRFDGQSWRLYTDAAKTHAGFDMVAGRSGVWIVDKDGNLSHFDGARWTIRSLGGVVPPAGKDSRDYHPFLDVTGDGRLWVFWRGLWTQDGETWREVRSPGLNLAEVWPIGHDTENMWLWLWRTGEVAAVAPDGRIAARYGWREMGLTEPERFDGLVESHGRIWIASSAGLLTFDCGQWRNPGVPPRCTAITNVAVTPEGSVWVLAETRSLARVAMSYGLPLAACMIGLLVSILLISAWLRGRAENMLADEPALVAAAGPLPGIDVATGQADFDRHARPLRWKLCALLLGLPVAGASVEVAAEGVWPGAPALALRAGVLSLMLLASGAFWAWTRCRRRSAPGAESPVPSRFSAGIWAPENWILFVVILLFGCIAPLDWVNRLVPISALAKHARALLVLLPVALILVGRDVAALLLAKPAWCAGDYDRAIRWLGRLNFGRPNASLLQMEGLSHALANRPAEAERCYRLAFVKGYAALTSLVNPRSDRAGLLDSLGESLGDQRRYEEAQKCLQASIEMGDTNSGSSRIDLAELLLEQGNEPLKALELVDEAMRIAKGSVAARAEPWHLATRAWALAVLGRRPEAEQAIERVLRLRSETYASLFANTRLNVGMALLAMGQPQQAIEQFRAAYQADPKGKYGARALQQIELHSGEGR